MHTGDDFHPKSGFNKILCTQCTPIFPLQEFKSKYLPTDLPTNLPTKLRRKIEEKNNCKLTKGSADHAELCANSDVNHTCT